VRLPVLDDAKAARGSGFAALVVEPAIDLRDLLDPALAFAMLQAQDLLVRPVKVIRDIRDLLIEPL